VGDPQNGARVVRAATPEARELADQADPAALWAVGSVLSRPYTDNVYMLNAVANGARLRKPPPASDGVSADDRRWEWIVGHFSDWSPELMLRIIDCESGGDPDAVSAPDYDGLRNYGLFQIHGEPEELDLAYNIERAHEKWQRSQYWPWIGSVGCWGP